MSTLHTFGCSYTADYALDGGKYEEFYNIRGGNFPDVWPKILAKKLNFELNNFGKGGVGNDFIFNQICLHCQHGRFKLKKINLENDESRMAIILLLKILPAAAVAAFFYFSVFFKVIRIKNHIYE